MLSGARAGGRGPAAPLGGALQDAAQGIDVAPPQDDLTLAGVREAIGSAMMTLGMTARARPLLEAAYERFRQMPPDSDARLAVETELAELFIFEGKPAQAEAPLRDLLSRERAANKGVPTAREGDILNALGSSLRLTSRLSEAMTTQQEALALRQRLFGAAGLPVAESLNNIATIHFSAGRFKEAVDAYNQALSVRAVALRPLHPMVVQTQANLGLALLRAGDAAGALPYLQQAASAWRGAHGPDDRGFATVHTSLGQARGALAQLEESEAAFIVALQWHVARPVPDAKAVLATKVNPAVTRAHASKGDPDGCRRSIVELEALRADPVFVGLSAGLARLTDEALADAYERCGRAGDADRLRGAIEPITPK